MFKTASYHFQSIWLSKQDLVNQPHIFAKNHLQVATSYFNS